jgi:hypothetical protein
MARYLSLALAPIGFLLLFHAPAAATEAPARHHALSLIDEPAYGPEFSHFKWVTPKPPRAAAFA